LLYPAEWLAEPGGLADRLREIREGARLTGIELAGRLSWDRTKISKIENGRQWPSSDDIRAWTAACDVPGQASELLDMLTSARAQHRQWRHRARGGQAKIQADWDQLVRQAKLIRWFEVTVIPGLLQTPGYARCFVEENIREYGFPEAQADADVAARIRRQDALYEQDREFRFVIYEAALRTRIGPLDVMAEQLDRMLNLSGLSRISLAVIPFEAQQTITPLHGFALLDDSVIYETYAAEVTVDAEEAAVYGPVFDRLAAEAVTGDEARRLIADAAAALRGAAR
jgi:transcriptional regulator with XRE-family HTH domain